MSIQLLLLQSDVNLIRLAWIEEYPKFLEFAMLDGDYKFLVEYHLMKAAVDEGWIDLLPAVLNNCKGELEKAIATGLQQIRTYGLEYIEPGEGVNEQLIAA